MQGGPHRRGTLQEQLEAVQRQLAEVVTSLGSEVGERVGYADTLAALVERVVELQSRVARLEAAASGTASR